MRWLFEFRRRNPGQVWAWATYDFANSAFATTILAVIFNAYYAGVVAGGERGVALFGTQVPGATLFSWFVSGAMIITALLTPVLGALADLGGLKQRLLALHAGLGVAATLLLFTVHEGNWLWGGLLFLFGQIGFAGGNVFYNALLHDIAEPADFGKVSGIGWAWGYLGGGLLLAINLVMLQQPQLLGLPEKSLTVQHCFVSVGIWWALFTVPILRLRLPRATGVPTALSRTLPTALRDLRLTLAQLRDLPQFSRFFFAYLFYNDGVETVIVMASIFGSQELHMATTELIAFFLMIQGVALVGSLGFGYLADRFGNKRTVILSLMGWLVVVIWAWQLGIFGDAKFEYWLLGALAATVMGGAQAASRSLQAELIPARRSTEFFSFFGISGRFASAIGPLIFGAAVMVTGSLRTGILSLIVFFVIGLILLWPLDVAEGRRRAAAFKV